MGKSILISKLIEFLKTKEIVSRQEIANYLNINIKTVSTYVNEVNAEGIYYITSTTGKNGGYSLNKKNLSKGLCIDSIEYEALMKAKEIIKKSCIDIYPEIESICNKIKQNYGNTNTLEEINFNCKTRGNVNIDKNQRKKLNKLKGAIIKKQKIHLIKYKKNDEEDVEDIGVIRIIQPYEFINYDGFPYLLAFCELRNDFREFKLDRIIEFKILESTFEEQEDKIKRKELLKHSLGIYRGQKHNVKLKIRSPFKNIISEKSWTQDQTIIELNDKEIMFEGTLEGDEEIISWILSMRECVEIIEPEILKNKYLEVIKKIHKRNFN